MIRRVIFLLICLAFMFTTAEAKKSKWIYHIVKEGQTIEQVVRGYSVLYNVDMVSFLKWNDLKQWYEPKQGDIFKIANKPSKNILVAQKDKKEKSKKPKKRPKKPKKKPKKKIEINDQVMLAAIRFAGDYSGVRHAFLAGMLHVETGLGSNTGTCNYKKSKMGLPEQLLFEDICEELGYNPSSMQVSCPRSGQRGGAMGVAQFIPSTWKKYQSRISNVVGKKVPDPWDPRDATVAMALKVANDAPGVTKHSKKAEMDAAKMYFSGTTLSKYNKHARKVLAAANKFEDQF